MLNDIKIIGNIGNDPELCENKGVTYCNLSVATKEKYTDKKSGAQMENVQWHRVVFFDKAAAAICEYCRRGDKIFVGGKMEYKKYEKDGIKRVSAQIRAARFTLCGRGKKSIAEGLSDAKHDEMHSAPSDMDEIGDVPF